ncbi:conjugal transfer mating pair stabilization protein TraN [Aquipseudomonas alcaligenes]|uniref:Conjugal transfer mating pair stabilization protein TraN n=1 Tax=Aquipseudomonas alcaligenes TaxID=43263 RepID=A0A1N6XCD1_AQUAC|nr:conjugal transfer mating pair stabilization protein TraN [Pseudomonas alcaligenes]SIQ99973.1 conjugal transfer mating pair stabilization protein TraN [Pseudomonas alcaligenes]
MNPLRSRTFARLICYALVGLQVNTLAYPAYADSVVASQAAGRELTSQTLQAFPVTQPMTSLEQLYPDMTSGNTTDLQSVFGDDNKTIDTGIKANTKLKTEESMGGEAYRLLTDSSKRISPDLSKDPMFNQADQVRTGDFMTTFKENFADCKRTDAFENIKKKAHVAQYRTCERLTDMTGSYTFKHDYKIGIVEYVAGQPNYQSCGPGCLYVWVGTVGDNYWGGHCSVYEEYTSFKIINPEAVKSAVIEYAKFDDYFQIILDNKMVWTHTPGVFPPETGGACERSTSWQVNPATDVTSAFRSEGKVVTFKTRTSVSGGGEGYARIRITYDPAKAVKDNGWGPEENLPLFDQIKDGFCSNVNITCTSNPDTDGDGCATVNGVTVCESALKPSPHPSIPRFCQTVEASADCAFYKGPMKCYKDPQGVEHCHQNEGGNLDSCQALESNPQCGFISQKCINGAGGDNGCYAYEEVWDCGYDTEYETAVNTGATIECPGGARCMGSECFDTSNVKSGDFAYAVAMLQLAQFAEHDLDCGGDGTDINQANECKIFKGEAMECKKALGGYVDCCEAPESVSIIDYVNLTMNTLKMTSSMEALARTGNLFAPGYWAAGSNAAVSVGSSIIKGQWGTIVDSATAAFQKTLEGAVQETLLSELQQWLMQQAYDAMLEMGATAAADAVFATGADGAVTGLGQTAGMVVNIIGWVYMVYVIADLLIKIIWECEQKEFELGAKKETRQCHFVGSYCASEALGGCVEKRETYCCFGSVVGRIVQEAAREQLGLGWGEIETPSCEGITPTQMAQMDWDRVDLSEWIGMLNLAGRLPTLNTVSLEHLTGSGSRLQTTAGDTRLNTLDRNMQRLDGFDVDAVKKKAEQDMR